MVVQAPAPQTSAYDWKPQPKEDFESWVNRLAQHWEETANANKITSARTL